MQNKKAQSHRVTQFFSPFRYFTISLFKVNRYGTS